MQIWNSRLIVYKTLRRLWSHHSWVVLYRSAESMLYSSNLGGYQIRPARPDDADGIRVALPNELVSRLSEHDKASLIAARFRSNMPCFVVEDNGRVIGGCWCPEISPGSQLVALAPDKGRLFEISRLYVSPEYRGKGIASALCDEVCLQMGAAGYDGGLSLVWYTRPASIRSHLNAGFTPVGEKNTWTIAGFRWIRYASHFREDGVLNRSPV